MGVEERIVWMLFIGLGAFIVLFGCCTRSHGGFSAGWLRASDQPFARPSPSLRPAGSKWSDHQPIRTAHFGQISTTRMTQIMWLGNLAPDIQEEILFLPRTTHGRDEIKEADIRPIAKTLD
jgi:hypothetical protein